MATNVWISMNNGNRGSTTASDGMEQKGTQDTKEWRVGLDVSAHSSFPSFSSVPIVRHQRFISA